jgi:uncharacterized lipoprotein YddW (UPF0748 family)
VQEARQRIPTAVAVMSGQRNRPTAMPLIRAKVQANRAQGLGVAFFYLESLWSLGPEPATERIAALNDLLNGRLTPPAASFPPSPPPPLPSLSPSS